MTARLPEYVIEVACEDISHDPVLVTTFTRFGSPPDHLWTGGYDADDAARQIAEGATEIAHNIFEVRTYRPRDYDPDSTEPQVIAEERYSLGCPIPRCGTNVTRRESADASVTLSRALDLVEQHRTAEGHARRGRVTLHALAVILGELDRPRRRS